MASYSSKLSEKKYNNWVKAQLAVLFTKDGLEPFVCHEVQEFRLKCLDHICYNNGLMSGTLCSNCCTENVIKCPTNRICNVGRGRCSYHRNAATRYNPVGCPNKICHDFTSEIQNVHRYYGPSYKNTDATQWCSNTWEIAKCFMPPDGYKDVVCAQETDFNGIISVIINYKDLQLKVHENLGNKNNIFEQAREIGRNLRHSPTLEVEDVDLHQYFIVFQQLLSDAGYLATDVHAQNAKQKLIDLENDTMVIGKDDIRKVLDDVAKAAHDTIRVEKDDQKRQSEIIKEELIKRKQEDLCSLDSKTHEGLQLIETKSDDSLKTIETKIDKSVQEIEKARDNSVQIIHQKKEDIEEKGKIQNKRIREECERAVETIREGKIDLTNLAETLEKNLHTRIKEDKEKQYIDNKQRTVHDLVPQKYYMMDTALPTVKSQFSNSKFFNWIKAAIAVLYTKDEIEPVIVNEVKDFQQNSLNTISASNSLPAGSTCSNCCTENLIVCPTNRICNAKRGKCSYHKNAATKYRQSGCPNKICHHLKSEIQSAHRYHGPSYKNTDATKWCSNAWEIAKCYLPPDGYKDVSNAAETDFNGIISVIINHKGFEAKIKDDLSKKNNIFDKGRDVGKAVRHSPNLEVEDTDLTQYFTILNNILTDPGFMAMNKSPNNAIQKLAKLQSDDLIIGKDVVRKVLEDVGKTIQEQIRNEMDTYKQETEKRKLELIDIIILKVKDIENVSLAQLNDVINSSIDAFDAKVKQSIQEIENLARKGKETLESVASDGVQTVNKEKENAIMDIQKAAEKSRGNDAEISEETYQKKKKELKYGLIKFYKMRHGKVFLTPLFEENDTPLASFYIRPELNSAPTRNDEKTHVRSLSEIFKTGNQANREIHVIADAGVGKTAFSNYLAITWCQAHFPDEDMTQYFKKDDIDCIQGFDFLFLVLLRDSNDLCSIDDLIVKNIVSNLGLEEKPSKDFLIKILKNEKCLVILDGLDEWTHPEKECHRSPKSIPHRNDRENSTILTTTRPWKLGVLNLNSCQIGKKVELTKLSYDSAVALTERILQRLKSHPNKNALQRDVAEFILGIESRQNDELTSVPLLIYTICLWCDGVQISNSKCELYINIVELLLSRTIQKHGDIQQFCVLSDSGIPECLAEYENCMKYYPLLMCLGKLAYYTFINKTRENTLVFDGSVAKKYITPDEMKFILHSGMLSESTTKTVTKKFSKVSFSHKTFQEFFAAIFISSQSDAQKTAVEKCRTVEDILDMSKICEFISGMNADLMCAISNDLMSVINEDEKTRDYRTRTGDDNMYNKPLYNIQQMFMSCLQEMPKSENFILCIQDFFIDWNTVDSEQLQRLLKQNKTNIKSLYIDISGTSSSLHEIIDLFSLTDLSHIQKLHYCGDVEEAEINRILFPSLQVVTLEHGTWTNKEESSLFLSGDMLSIERVKLEDINMSTEGLQNFMTELQKLPQSVTVKMTAIKPRRQYDRVIEKIRKSPTFHVFADNYYHYYSDEDDNREWNFEFKTIKNDLRQYLERFYSESATFYNFNSDLEGSQNVSLEICPTFRKLDITNKEVTVMNQNESMTESLQMHKYPYNDIRRSKPILLLAEDTTSSANFIVSSWLNFGGNQTFFPMDLNTLEGVFWLKVRYFDDVSDLKTMLNYEFEMKKMYYSQQILIIFEYFDKDHFKLKAIYDLACSCNLKTCSFIIITKIDKQIVDDMKLNIEVVLISAAINALYVYSKHLNVVIDGHELSRRIDQIVSEKKRDAITKICFVDIHPINSTAKICVPGDIKDIRFHRCSHKFQVIHFANHLEISEPPRFTNPLTENIFTPKLTTLTIHFESPSHIFYYNVYEHFACNISKANHIEFLRLCDMSFGKKVINVQLQKEEIEQIRRSVESKGDYCRFGARILGPRLGKITFDKEDIEIERSNSFVKQIMLDLICYELVKTHSSVSECYPSEMNDGAILLICFVNDEFQIDSFNGFRLLKRYNNNISKESLLAGNACDIEENTIVKALEDDFKDINETLSFHAEALMTSHRNLEAVKVSFVQHKDIQLVHSNLCIVLYCKAKGYIPFGDVCFPRTLNNPLKKKSFRTDVRDGFFSTCHFRSGHSTGFNKKLALGSSIGEVGGNLAATLGPFVNIKETNTTCFLTVRHAFAPLSRSNESLKGVNVVQPADVHLIPGAVGLPNRHCGMVIESQDGGQIDASLVQISPERLPTSGQFIQLTKEDLDFAGLTKQPIYNDGKILDAKTLTVRDLVAHRVIKIGYKTSLTKGALSTTEGRVKETVEYSPLETLYNGSRESFQIRSQIMVDSFFKNVFTQAGDSGSGVFLVDDKESLHCIGMLIGVCTDMTAVVTPINNILQILGHKMGKTLELKKFRETEEMDES